MDNQPILSLCIPTNGAVEWVLPVIESIYAQGYDNEKFEVVITDNGKDSQLPEHIAKMTYPNLRYKQTTDEGFLNLVTSLKEGRGLFCKMINHRSIMIEGSIEKMVALVEKYKETQPMIYCVSGHINKPEIVECENMDSFIQNLSYWCSWSAGIGFWQKDIQNIDNVNLNFMFPNASLLLDIRNESEYVIWNYKYQKMADDAGKGGYDFYYTFAVVLLDLISALRIDERISIATFLKFKRDLLYDYLYSFYYSDVVCPTKRTYIVQNVRESMMVYYSDWDYRKMVFWSYFRRPFAIIKHTLLKLIGKK